MFSFIGASGMNTFILVIVLWTIAFCATVYLYHKPKKRIVQKYGIPLFHFSGMECINTIPIQGKIDMDFYPEFIVISECDKEYVLDKNFKDFKFYGSYFTLVFEFKINGKAKQMLLKRKQKKLLYDFFDIY